MTFYEAIVPVCLQMFREGEIVLSSKSQWHFDYASNFSTAVEQRARELSNTDVWPRIEDIAKECLKAAAICKLIENSPLNQALR